MAASYGFVPPPQKIVQFSLDAFLKLAGKEGGFYWVLEGEDTGGSLDTELGPVQPGKARVIIEIANMPALAQLLQRVYLTEMTRDMYE